MLSCRIFRMNQWKITKRQLEKANQGENIEIAQKDPEPKVMSEHRVKEYLAHVKCIIRLSGA